MVTIVRACAWSVLLASAVCAPPTFADVPKVIRVGCPGAGIGNRGFVGGSPFAVMHVKGLLEEEFKRDGIRIEYSLFKGAGPAVNEAAANGQLDVWHVGDLPAMVARAGGLKHRVLLASNSRVSVYVAVPADSSVTRLEDLRGRRVAVNKGTTTHLQAARFLAAHGLSERDVRVINMQASAAKAALATKDVDAMVGQTDLLTLRDRGVARIIYASRGESGEYGQSTLMASEDFLDRYPHIVQRIVNVWVRAAHWTSLEQNRHELFKLWEKSGVPYRSWATEYEGRDLKEKSSPLLDDYIVARYRAGLEDARRLGFIRKTVDVETWFDRRFLENALKATGLQDYWRECDASGKHKPKADAGRRPRAR